MVAVGGSIGTGLLLGSGAAVQIAGPAVSVAYLVGAAITWTVAMALGEMASVHPAAGSFGVYAERYLDRKSTRLNSSHIQKSRMPSSA